ncbi:MAG: hypothetical protein J6I47_06595 [Ruminococcus sp.]|nr:hypothetical protein [Ruminococcus sp.]
MNFSKLRITAIAALLCLSVTACGNSDNSSSAEKKSENNTISEESSVTSDTTDESSTFSSETTTEKEKTDIEPFPSELTDNLLDYRFSIDGEVLSMPCTLEQLRNNGWMCKSDLERKEIRSNDEYSITLEKDSKEIQVTIYNNSKERINVTENNNLDEISIKSLHCFAYNNPEGTKIVLPKGIELNSATKDDIIAAYGKAQDKDSFSGMESYYYYEDTDIKDHQQCGRYYCINLDKPEKGAEKVAISIQMFWYK